MSTDADRAAQEDLRTTTEAIRADAARIETLEAEKAVLDPGDPRVTELSRQVVELAGRLQKTSLVELELTEEVRVAQQDGRDRPN